MFLETKKDGEQTAKTLEPWRQLLLDAADYKERVGHSVGSAEGPNGEACFIHSLNKVRNLTGEEVFAVATRFARFVGDDCAVHYSDTHTGPEVIAAMRACAKS